MPSSQDTVTLCIKCEFLYASSNLERDQNAKFYSQSSTFFHRSVFISGYFDLYPFSSSFLMGSNISQVWPVCMEVSHFFSSLFDPAVKNILKSENSDLFQ